MSHSTLLNNLLKDIEVDWKPLGEVGEFIRGNGMQKKDLTEEGFPAIHYGQLHTKFGLVADKTFSFVSEELGERLRKAEKNDLLLATTSESDEDVVKPVAWLGAQAAISGDMMLFRHDQNVKYLAYFFQSEGFQSQKKRYIRGAKVRRVSKDDLAKICAPIPRSKDVQAKIADVLDRFSSLSSEVMNNLNIECESRKKQYSFYRNRFFEFKDVEHEWMKLGDVGEVRMCKRILKKQTLEEGEVPFYKIGTFGKKPNAYITRELFDEYRAKYNYPRIGEVLISASGTIGRAVIFDGIDAYFQDSNIVWLENDESLVLNKYLYYFYQIANWNISDGGVIKRLYNDNIKKTLIPVPYPNNPKRSLEEQARIVSFLDQLDSSIGSIVEMLNYEIKLRNMQYTYYRDLLLDFPQESIAKGEA